MPGPTGLTGHRYEEAALQWLQHQGLRPVTRNFRAKTGEIDLIALDQDCLVFIEVRSRSNSRYVAAAASVDWRKQRRLVKTAQIFLQRNRQWQQMRCRFDVVAFDPPQSGSGTEPTWIKGAFNA
jgi:putative endonuclease